MAMSMGDGVQVKGDSQYSYDQEPPPVYGPPILAQPQHAVELQNVVPQVRYVLTVIERLDSMFIV